MKKQNGFTLIELIVVIVILGILTATALPRFINLSSDARAGVMRGVEASMRGANTMLYGKAAAEGHANDATSSVTTNGATVNLAFGYAADATELARVLDLNPATDFTVSAAAIQHAGAATPASCEVAYTPVAAANGVPVYTAPLSDCN